MLKNNLSYSFELQRSYRKKKYFMQLKISRKILKNERLAYDAYNFLVKEECINNFFIHLLFHREKEV